MKEKILKFLKESNDFVSGQKISEELNVTRAAVWKYINALKKEGYEISSITKKGYKLINSPDILNAEEVNKHLNTLNIGKKIIHYNTINSTNIEAKNLANDGEIEGTVIISEEQINGRGRLGRGWVSPKNKGIWMSIILRPDINPVDAAKVTQIGAASVLLAIKNTGLDPLVKWPNDIVVDGKKVCGILTEMNAELHRINYLVIGIGINVNIEENEYPNEIKEMATSLKIQTGKTINRKKLTADILNYFEEFYNDFKLNKSIKEPIKICRNNSALIGKEVLVIKNGESIKVTAVDINDEGVLLIRNNNGEIEELISGEVSVRGLYGYV